MDADDTLLDFGKCEMDALRSVLDSAGLPSGDEIIASYSAINQKYWQMLERRQITKERLKYARFEEFLSRQGFDADPAETADKYADWLAFQHSLLPGAMETVRRLSRDRDIYIITNGIGPVQEKRVADSGLLPYLRGVFISDVIGSVKPSRGFFEEVARAIPGFDPESALVVGDSLSSDIKGGIGFGLDVCWVNRGGHAVPDGMKIDYVIDSVTKLPELLDSIGR